MAPSSDCGQSPPAGRRDSCRTLNITVKRCWHRHQMGAFLLEHVGDAQLTIVRMLHLIPQRPAPGRQPCIQISEPAEALPTRVNPDTQAAVLHVLLDEAFPPATGDVAEVR